MCQSLANLTVGLFKEFNESVIKCLPTVPWAVSDRKSISRALPSMTFADDYYLAFGTDDLSPNVRRDFRDNRVFTIDPETARDLDDALHIVDNEDGTFEVGVHIADVTHFVKVRLLSGYPRVTDF